MKTALILLSLLSSVPTFAASLPQLARCSVKGASLWEPAKLSGLLLDDGGTRVIALALAEENKEEHGTYLTFAHLNLGLTRVAGKDLLTLNVTTSTNTPIGVQRDEARPLWARVTIPSRVKGANLEVELRCERASSAYALEPLYDYNVDPVFGAHYVATTVPDFAAARDANIGSALSRGEFLAANYCVAGSAAVAAEELKARPEMFRTDAADHHTALTPETVSVARDGAIQYGQRAQEIVCVKSHVERQLDPDTGEMTDATVCDESQKRDLAPVTVRIPACE